MTTSKQTEFDFVQELDDVSRYQFEKHFSHMQLEVHANARRKGFWLEDINQNLGEKLALIHSEVSEALEALRIGDREGFATELADVVIRVMDLAEARGINLASKIAEKHHSNLKRPFRHGKQF